MTKKDIVQVGHEVLRAKAAVVPLADIDKPKIKKVLKDMASALADCPDGVGIAAPQIGVSLQIFLVAGRVQAARKKDVPTPDGKPYPDEVYINPKLVKLSAKKVELEEGCLSVVGKYGRVLRAEKARVEAYNEKGEKFSKSASGFLAQIFQHEVDHLNGVLFIDKATELEEVAADHDRD